MHLKTLTNKSRAKTKDLVRETAEKSISLIDENRPCALQQHVLHPLL